MTLFIPATIYWQCNVIARCLYGMTVIKRMTIFTDWKTALWGLKATSWMPHQIKAKSAAKEYRASLGKGYRPVAAASCVLGQKMMCQCTEDHLDPPWKSNRSVGRRVLGGPLCHHSEMELAQKANKISPHLSLKPRPTLVWVMGFSVVLFVCLFGLEPMDTQHGVKEEKRRNGGRTGKESRGGDEGGRGRGGGEDVWHTDLPLRWRETCRGATRQSCSTNIHRPQDQGNKDGSLSLILQQMLFLTRVRQHRQNSCKFYKDFLHVLSSLLLRRFLWL